MTSDCLYVTQNGQSLEYDGIFLKHSMPVPDQFITMLLLLPEIGSVDKRSGNSKTARKSVVINGTKKQKKVTEKVHQAAIFPAKCKIRHSTPQEQQTARYNLVWRKSSGYATGVFEKKNRGDMKKRQKYLCLRRQALY